MRFLLLLYPKSRAPGAAALVDEMLTYNDALAQAGVLLALDGLHPPDRGARVFFGDGGRRSVSDGPFGEASEVVGGYWMIQARSREEAIEWARRAPCPAGAMIEIRPVLEQHKNP